MLLRVNPGERLGALGMEEVRRHPWFKSLNWKGIRNDNDDNIMKRNKEIGILDSNLNWKGEGKINSGDDQKSTKVSQ